MLEYTIGEMLEEIAKKQPEHLAVKYTDRNYCRTYKEFNEECDKIAKAFLKMGIKKGDHVAMWASNIPEWLITLFACAKIGAVLVTVNTAYKVYELEYLLRQSDAKVLVLMEQFKGAKYIDILKELIPNLSLCDRKNINNARLPKLKNIIYCSDETVEGTYSFKELYDMSDNISDSKLKIAKDNINNQDIANIQYTSGTTGFPKGVMLTHYNILNDGKAIGDCMKFTNKDKLLIVVPFFHCFGLVLGITACLTHGSSMIPVDLFSPQKVMKAISDEKCTAVHGVPTMFIAMLNQQNFDEFNFSSLRTGIMAGSPCPTKVMNEVVKRMGIKEITIAYGQTESSPVSTQTTTDDTIDIRVSTVGKALPHIECKIVDTKTGEKLPPNVSGEFCSRGYNTMKGYYKMPQATAQVIDEYGWLHSGDLAMVDENGYYKITGRIKDMIIRGGENIYPKEIEEFLHTLHYVKDVQVIGVPSEVYGEEICACIILDNRFQKVKEETIKESVKKSMAKHKVPSYIWFLDEFPMTASGKIQKFKLRDLATKKFGLETTEEIETA